MTLHFLNDAVHDTDSTQKLKVTSYRETIDKLINRIPGSRL